MRVTSDFFVSALRRRAESAGAFAFVEAKGAHSAGAIYISVLKGDGRYDLLGPAPQNFFSQEPEDRKFEVLLADEQEPEIRLRLLSEKKFDPDIWIVEIEDKLGRNFVEVIDTNQ